jgi:hypothetical protein
MKLAASSIASPLRSLVADISDGSQRAILVVAPRAAACAKLTHAAVQQ